MRRVTVNVNLEQYNPYHDPRSGKFTSPTGSGVVNLGDERAVTAAKAMAGTEKWKSKTEEAASKEKEAVKAREVTDAVNKVKEAGFKEAGVKAFEEDANRPLRGWHGDTYHKDPILSDPRLDDPMYKHVDEVIKIGNAIKETYKLGRKPTLNSPGLKKTEQKDFEAIIVAKRIVADGGVKYLRDISSRRGMSETHRENADMADEILRHIK